jgi:hypothetical protein
LFTVSGWMSVENPDRRFACTKLGEKLRNDRWMLSHTHGDIMAKTDRYWVQLRLSDRRASTLTARDIKFPMKPEIIADLRS